MRQYLRIAEQWLAEPHVLITRYEDLLTQYEKETRRLVEFLHLDWAHPPVQNVFQRYHPDRDVSGQSGLHFYKGKLDVSAQCILVSNKPAYEKRLVTS